MKTCVCCKIPQDSSVFVKSPRYRDGLAPYCRTCRKLKYLARVAKNPMCCHCKTRPHQPNHLLCYDCQRFHRGQSPTPKRRTDKSNKLWCCKCKERPRREYHAYCHECGNQDYRDRLKKNRTVKLVPEKRRKASARHYVNQLLKRGKIKRQPCEHCGNPSVHFHHLDYKDRTTNIQHVCHPCHVRLEREKRLLLTVS